MASQFSLLDMSPCLSVVEAILRLDNVGNGRKVAAENRKLAKNIVIPAVLKKLTICLDHTIGLASISRWRQTKVVRHRIQ